MNDFISRQEAIELVKDVCNAIMSGCDSYYDPETDDKVYKDILEVDAILKCNKEMRIALKNMPPAQPEIIRCKDCVYSGDPDEDKWRLCHYDGGQWNEENHYCGYAKRSEKK